MAPTPASFPGIAASGHGLAAESVDARCQAGARLDSIDLTRGLVMVLMALDHVRDFFGIARFDPLDPAVTTAPWYLTRWVTHLCAPTFILLAGISAWLMSRRLTRHELSGFLLRRGLWLVALEFTVVSFAWMFSLNYTTGLYMQVIWAIGASMICLAALVRLPHKALFAFAVLTIVGHNALDGIQPAQFGAWAPLWSVLHVEGATPFGFVSYPLIPWIGVMALGFAVGPVYDIDAPRRRRVLMTAGVISVLAFFALRLLNGYGDPMPWTHQPTLEQTLFSFFNVQKYPPSLLYLLATLGIGCMVLSTFGRHDTAGSCKFLRRTDQHDSQFTLRNALIAVLRTFGRVPLFFYVLHLFIAHSAAGVFGVLCGRGLQIFTTPSYNLPPDWGLGVGGVCLAWAALLMVTYPLCRWFAQVKRQRSDWWLAYL